MQDMAGRAKVEIFAPREDCLCQTEEYYVYLNKEKRKLQTELFLLDFLKHLRQTILTMQKIYFRQSFPKL